MDNSTRPTAPHLTIYRWPITMLVSILHRTMGVALGVGLIVLAAWLMQAAAGPEAYQAFRSLMSTIVGKLLLIGWTFAFFIHLGNGIRHLIWDTGHGLEKRHLNGPAWVVLVSAIVLTAGFWMTKL
jgi:succinate dehydrogenase / fumarate reductase cytochrome b subunit